MNEIDRFLQETFRDLPGGEESVMAAKEALRVRMIQQYEDCIRKGMSPAYAYVRVVEEFGRKEGAAAEITRQKLLKAYQHFMKRYPRMVKAGFLGIIICPLVFLVLMLGLEWKLIFLTFWILSILILAVYILTVEYIHFRLNMKMDGLDWDSLAQEQEDSGEERQ